MHVDALLTIDEIARNEISTLTDKWTMKIQYINTIESHSTVKKICYKTCMKWMELENTILCEVTQKIKCFMWILAMVS